MKKILFIGCWLLAVGYTYATGQTDSVFCGHMTNAEYSVYLEINFYKKNITIKGAEFLGEMAGYLGDLKDSRKWYITDAEVKDSKHAVLYLTNDGGSEDLEATLSYDPDTKEYTLKQGSGSTLKIARNRKWKKLPSTLTFR